MFISSKKYLVSLFATLALGACDMDVPNLDGLDISELTDNPTPQLVAEFATGLIQGHRAGVAGGNGYVSILGVLGRESYNLDANDPRFLLELLESESLDPGSPAFGANFWINPYNNIRNGSLLLGALEKTPGLSAADKNAISGFTKTIQALDFLVVVNTRYDNGAPVQQPADVYDTTPGPLVSRADIYAHIKSLLDAGRDELELAGSAFPFPLTSGFNGFDTPAAFIQFNRAIRARVSVYSESWDEAEEALAASFLDSTGALALGVYHVYGTGKGDITNGLSSNSIVAHPRILEGAQTNASSGDLDARVVGKLVQNPNDRLVVGDYSSDVRFKAYANSSASIPIIRNEELLLLRAEVNIRKETPDYDAALADLNLVRESSGNLPPLDAIDDTNAIDALLYERRYSLLFEGGHRWIDMRRFGRLEELKNEDVKDGLTVHMQFPIPSNECNARELTAAECKAPAAP